jgi:hypothetical protein
VVPDIFDDLWTPLLFDRKNPDGGNIGATFFVPHEYTDYQRVQDLYLRGFEIGANSITYVNQAIITFLSVNILVRTAKLNIGLVLQKKHYMKNLEDNELSYLLLQIFLLKI